MTAGFRLNVRNPCHRISDYVRVLKQAHLPNVDHRRINDTARARMMERNHELRTLQYCAYVHPVTYHANGNNRNWHDVENIVKNYMQGIPFYKPDEIHLLPGYFRNQKPFIKKIQEAKINFGSLFPQESIVRYEQFMTLVKKHGKLTPPLDVDFVWHDHMLHHEAYVQATTEYHGRIVDHLDDFDVNAELEALREKTIKAWESQYGKTFFDDALFHRWLGIPKAREVQESGCFVPLASCSTNCSTGSSCGSSSCGSGCGGGCGS